MLTDIYTISHNDNLLTDIDGNVLHFEDFNEAFDFMSEEAELTFELDNVLEYGFVDLYKKAGWEIIRQH